MSPTTTGRAFHVGLSPARVIDEAAALTRASHVLTWSIRDLATALEVSPAVIYHHYKAELLRRPARSGPWKSIEDLELATLGWGALAQHPAPPRLPRRRPTR
ncbi:hypothetical protein QE374_002815 [Microbacterium sp. SORGH_AS428]|nr:hypothetical protein [Microbacterium sp. SORGH_AS_0428]